MLKRPLYLIRNTNDEKHFHHVVALQRIIQKQFLDKDVLIISSSEQLAWVKSNIPIAINLDPFSRITTHHCLDICRIFNTEQRTQISFQNRPGTEPIFSQIQALPSGSFILMDDDICTGGTMSFIRTQLSLFRPDIAVTKEVSLMHNFLPSLGFDQHSIYDIIDSHDFIGHKTTSGLMVVNSSGVAHRQLYTHSTVNLHYRAKLSNPKQFLLDWQQYLNHLVLLHAH
jgi:hypothetical protein